MLQKRTVTADDAASLVSRAVLAVAALVLGGCAAFDGLASSENGFDRRLYVGGGALVSRLEPDTDDEPGLELDEERGAGGSLAAGYDLTERVTLELHVAELGEATLEPDGEVGYRVGGLSGIVYGLNDDDARHLREGFSVFGRLGVGTLRNEADGVEYERANDAHVLLGAGVEYGLQNGLALRAEIVAHETDAKYAQLGLLYRFGEAGLAPVARTPARDEPAADGAGRDGERTAPSGSAAPAADAGIGADSDTDADAETADADADADGVPDLSDACADTPAGRAVDGRGCELFDGPVEGLAFESDSDTLSDAATEILDEIARRLRDHPDVVVAIEAHTDNRGAADDNLEVARRRALAVARYLAGEGGIEPSRLKPRAFGESRPLVSNATPEGRARNRRIELSVVP